MNLHHEFQTYLDNINTLENVSLTIYFAMYGNLLHWSHDLDYDQTKFEHERNS